MNTNSFIQQLRSKGGLVEFCVEAFIGAALGLIFWVVVGAGESTRPYMIPFVGALLVPALTFFISWWWRNPGIDSSYKVYMVFGSLGIAVLLILIGDLVRKYIVKPIYIGEKPLQYALIDRLAVQKKKQP